MSACGGGGGGGPTVCPHLYCFSEAPTETSTFTLDGESRTVTSQDPVNIKRSDENGLRYFELNNTIDDPSTTTSTTSDVFSRTSKSALSTHSSIDQEDGDWNLGENVTSADITINGITAAKLRVYGYSKSSATPPINFDDLAGSYSAGILIAEEVSATGTVSYADGSSASLSTTSITNIHPFQVGGSMPTNIPTSGTFTYSGLIIEHNNLFQFRENHKMGSFSLEVDFGDSAFEFKDVSGSTVRLVGSGELSSDGSFQASDLELLSNGKSESSAYGSILGNGGSHVGGIWHTNEDSNYKFGAFIGDK